MKKGQVTVFIIIGIILLIASLIVISLKHHSSETRIKEQVLEPTKLPGDLDKVRVFITNCFDQAATEGLKRVGYGGGWVSLDDPTLAGRTFVFTPFQTNADGMMFGSIKVPYWFYMDSDDACQNNCHFASNRPPLKSIYTSGAMRDPTDLSIEAQLDRFVARRTKECLDNYNNFRNEFTITEKSPLLVTTTITPADVVFSMDYNVVVKKGSAKGELKKFYIKKDVPLFELYDVASQITNAESYYHFIEESIMNMIVINSGIDNTKLPPISATTIDPGKQVVWLKEHVRQQLKDNILIPFTQALQIPGTLGYNEPRFKSGSSTLSTMQQGLLDSFSVRVLNETHNNIEAGFIYLGNGLYFDITPSNGGLLEPTRIQGTMGGFMSIFVQNYEFKYDISYPVLVVLDAPLALKSEGYKFQFALEPNIRNNKAFRPGSIVYKGEGEIRSLFTSPLQRISGNITIKTFDKRTKKPLPGVLVKYQCADEEITIGTTRLTPDKKEAKLIEKFPICKGGILKLSHEGYLDYAVRFDTEVGKSEVVIVGSTPGSPHNLRQD